MWPAVALGLVLAALAIGLTYRWRGASPDRSRPALAGALVAVAALSSANNSYVLPHSTSAPLAIVLALAAVLGAGRRRHAAAPRRLGGRPVRPRRDHAPGDRARAAGRRHGVARRARSGRRAGAGAPRGGTPRPLLVPALAVPALVYGAFLTRVSLHDLLLENLYPIDFVRAAGHVVLDAHAPMTAASVAKLAAHVALYAAGAAALVALARLAAARPRLTRALPARAPGRPRRGRASS